MKVRKQVYDLTLEDFDLAPIWEFAHDEEGDDGQDEATVRPVAATIPLESVDVMCVARADFLLADGTAMSGFLSPGIPNDTNIGHLQPTIISEQGQMSFWCGIVEPSREQLDASYMALGKSPQEIFPLSFSLAVAASHSITGTISGFLVRSGADFESVTIVQ